MRVLTLVASDTPSAAPSNAVVCHDVRNPAQRSEVLVRKGAPLAAAEVAPLFARGISELHLAIPDTGDLGEDEAAQRLGAAVAGSGASCDSARFGQATFISSERGVLRIDASRLDKVNALDDVLLLTAEADRPVDVGDALGVIKCASLFLPRQTLSEVERIVMAGGPVIHVQPFRPMRVGFVAPRHRLRGGAFERAQAALSQALEWYGSSLDVALAVGESTDSLAAAYRQLHTTGVELIFAAGASGTDPSDVVFEGLRRADGQVHQIGIPAEPGTACWIGALESTPVLGLASCELFGQPGALDLLLPRIFTGESLDRGLVRRLALGGLLHGPSRIPPYHGRSGSTD